MQAEGAPCILTSHHSMLSMLSILHLVRLDGRLWLPCAGEVLFHVESIPLVRVEEVLVVLGTCLATLPDMGYKFDCWHGIKYFALCQTL